MYLALVCCLLFFNFSSASFITRTLPLAICPPSVFSLSECVFAGQYQRWATIFAISPRRRRRRRHTQPFLRLLRSSRVWARFLFSYFVPPPRLRDVDVYVDFAIVDFFTRHLCQPDES